MKNTGIPIYRKQKKEDDTDRIRRVTPSEIKVGDVVLIKNFDRNNKLD